MFAPTSISSDYSLQIDITHIRKRRNTPSSATFGLTHETNVQLPTFTCVASNCQCVAVHTLGTDSGAAGALEAVEVSAGWKVENRTAMIYVCIGGFI